MINALKTEKQDAETEVRELRKTIGGNYLRANPSPKEQSPSRNTHLEQHNSSLKRKNDEL